MNSASSYGDADEDRNDDSLLEKVHFASLLILYVGVNRMKRFFGELDFFFWFSSDSCHVASNWPSSYKCHHLLWRLNYNRIFCTFGTNFPPFCVVEDSFKLFFYMFNLYLTGFGMNVTFYTSFGLYSISRRLRCYRKSYELQHCVRMSVKLDFWSRISRTRECC